MNKIQKVETTGKAFNCQFHGIVPQTVADDCFYCESVGMSGK
jgi:hypothetical protein